MKNQSGNNKQSPVSNVKFWIFYHLGLFAFSVIAALVIKAMQNGEVAFPETWITIATIFLISVLLGYLASFMVKKGSQLSHAALTKRMIPYFLFFLVLSFVIANLVVSLGVLLYYLTNDLEMQHFLPNLFRYELRYASKSIIMWLMLFSIVFFYVLWRRSASKEQSLREEKLKYQYQKLKAQINPHFLFNSFGTLSELVYENPQQADIYIQELSSIYRYIIDNEENRLVTLNEEINFAQRFFHLQQQRLDDKVKLNLNVVEPDGYMVVPVSVQGLIENAMKHNTATARDPLVIDVVRENDCLMVKNNLQKKNTMEPTTRKGLQNLNEQVKLILGKELQVIENHDTFTVKLPMTFEK